MFGYLKYDQYNITISYQILEVNYKTPCYLTLNFKNTEHDVDETTTIYHDGE